MDLNKVSLIGNLANDPESKEIASGQKVAYFNLATNYVWKDAKTNDKKNRVDFHKIVAWGPMSDIISTYLKKGSKIYMEGRLQNRSWEDKEKNKKYSTEVLLSDLIMLGGRSKKEVKGDETAQQGMDLEEIQLDN